MTKPQSTPPSDPPRTLLLPGMAAISIWMLIVSIVGVVGVLTGHYPSSASRIAVLLLSTLFAGAGFGLMRRRRWGWALTLGAAFLSICFACYSLFHWHQGQWIVMGAVNLIFFLYLVRPEIVSRLE